MKLLITAACCLSSLMSFCQVSGDNNEKRLPQNLAGQTNRFQQMLLKNLLLAKKQGNVAFLPQDRMPCLVPDTAGMVPLPNAWPGVQVPFLPRHHAIPNPSGHIFSFQYNVLGNGLLPSKK